MTASDQIQGIGQITRRDVLRLGAASAIGGWLSGCAPCDAGFPPNMTMPVFYGYKDYSYTPSQANARLARKATAVIVSPIPVPIARVFYPSIDGTPAGARILTNCEPFPLVLLVHGDCGGVPYQQWLNFAGQLARAGYVVAVTFAGGTLASGDPQDDTLDLQSVYSYMRTSWEYRDTLMASPNTALIGHSYGGTLAAELATLIPIKAFVSLSGTFGQITAGPQAILSALHWPSLFIWNTVDDLTPGAVMGAPTGQMWSLVGAPKHGMSMAGGGHGDYLVPGSTTTCNQGTCNLVSQLSVDITTTFLTKYMPPGGLTGIAGLVPDSLIVRPQDFPPPPNHGFYAGAFLGGLAASNQTSSQPDSTKQPCFEQLFWQTGASQGSIYLIPA